MQSERKTRNLPDLLAGADKESWPERRKELLRILSEEVYGVTPEFCGTIDSFVESREENVHGGRAVQEWVRVSFDTPAGKYSFPFLLILPKGGTEPLPVFVHLSFQQKEQQALRFRDLDEFIPLEELLDNGYAVAILFYEEVTSDTGRPDGLARAYPSQGRSSWGKLGMWAFAASRVLDYLLTRPEIDTSRAAVSGWSRLGKAALWCGAQDQRFSLVISTESGCGGAAIERGKEGERVADITRAFPYWFCPAYREYAEKAEEMPFDQHFLLACIAPRALFIGSASEDAWADPCSEFLGAEAASEAYELLGVEGLRAKDGFPKEEREFPEGSIGYLLRLGGHGITRRDWAAHMRFRQIHGV